MIPPARRLLVLVLCFVAPGTVCITGVSPAHASLYWESGLRGSSVSVCFVGNAVSKRPDRVREVVSDIGQYEYAGNVRWTTVGGKSLDVEATGHIADLACPAPTKLSNGHDSFAGDVRVVLASTNVSGTGPPAGKGCTMFRKSNGKYDGTNNGWGSFSNSPNDLPTYRSCIYNLKLGDDPWPKNGVATGNPPSTHSYVNHTLHEFGHALGLAHEHTRNDVDPHCTAKGYGGNAVTGHLTVYDRDSVMSYQFLSCGINGNYANTGLSPLDQLGIHILYPEVQRVADIAGTTVVRIPDRLTLESAWQQAGADMSFDAHGYLWKLDGKTISTSQVLTAQLPAAGTYTLQFSYTDFLGRSYSYTGAVHALGSAEYLDQAAAVAGAATPLM